MEESRIEFIENKLQSWDFGKLQSLVTLLITAHDSGISVEEIKDYVSHIRQKQKEEMQLHSVKLDLFEIFGKKCPQCNRTMRLGNVGVNPKGWKHQWYCGYEDCNPLHEEFGIETVREVMKSIGL